MSVARLDNETLIEVNEAYVDDLGFENRQEVLGRTTSELGIWQDEDDRRTFVSRVARDGTVRNFETQFRRTDGAIEEMLLTAEVVNIDHTRAILGVGTKLTEFREAIGRVKAAEHRSHALLRNARELLFVLQSDLRITFAAPAVFSVLGLSRDEMIDRSLWDLCAAETGSALQSALEATLAGEGDSEELSFALTAHDGGTRWFEGILTNHTAQPEIDGFVLNAWDVTARRDLEQSLKQQVSKMGALRKIDLAITSSVEFATVLDTVLDQVVSQLEVDAADVYILSDDGRTLRCEGTRGFRTSSADRHASSINQGLFQSITNDAETLYVPDLSESRHTISRPWLLSREAFFEHAYDETLEGWVKALDLRDKDTQGHSLRVTDLTVSVAQAMHIRGQQLVATRRGALLHDIGKLGIPDSILHKPGPLTEKEYEVLKRHPDYAFRWLWQIAYLRPSVPIPYCHHERWDGTGYPGGLSGTDIPLEARIFAVADAWDAMTNDRPYRRALPRETAMEEIQRGAGTQFDPQVVATFLEVVQEKQNNG